MNRRILICLLVLGLMVGTATAQFGNGVVFDPTNYHNALLRYYQLQQHLAALLGDGLEPFGVGLAGRCYGAVNVSLGALRHLRDDLAGRRVDDRLRLAAGAVDRGRHRHEFARIVRRHHKNRFSQ